MKKERVVQYIEITISETKLFVGGCYNCPFDFKGWCEVTETKKPHRSKWSKENYPDNCPLLSHRVSVDLFENIKSKKPEEKK